MTLYTRLHPFFLLKKKPLVEWEYSTLYILLYTVSRYLSLSSIPVVYWQVFYYSPRKYANIKFNLKMIEIKFSINV